MVVAARLQVVRISRCRVSATRLVRIARVVDAIKLNSQPLLKVLCSATLVGPLGWGIALTKVIVRRRMTLTIPIYQRGTT